MVIFCPSSTTTSTLLLFGCRKLQVNVEEDSRLLLLIDVAVLDYVNHVIAETVLHKDLFFLWKCRGSLLKLQETLRVSEVYLEYYRQLRRSQLTVIT